MKKYFLRFFYTLAFAFILTLAFNSDPVFAGHCCGAKNDCGCGAKLGWAYCSNHTSGGAGTNGTGCFWVSASYKCGGHSAYQICSESWPCSYNWWTCSESDNTCYSHYTVSDNWGDWRYLSWSDWYDTGTSNWYDLSATQHRRDHYQNKTVNYIRSRDITGWCSVHSVSWTRHWCPYAGGQTVYYCTVCSNYFCDSSTGYLAHSHGTEETATGTDGAHTLSSAPAIDETKTETWEQTTSEDGNHNYAQPYQNNNWGWNHICTGYANCSHWEFIRYNYFTLYRNNSGIGTVTTSATTSTQGPGEMINIGSAYTNSLYKFQGWVTTPTAGYQVRGESGPNIASNHSARMCDWSSLLDSCLSQNNDNRSATMYAKWLMYHYYVNYDPATYQFKTACPDKNVYGDFSQQYCWYYDTYQWHGTPTNKYYYFLYWQQTEVSYLHYNPNNSFTQLCALDGGAHNVRAQWAPRTYRIKYNANNNAASGASMTTGYYSTEDAVTFWTPTNAQCVGYYLDHWNTSPDGTGTSFALGQVNGAFWYAPNTYTSDVIQLYGIWYPYNYNVVYKAGDGTGSNVSEVWTYNAAHNLYNNTPQLRNTYVAGTGHNGSTTPHFTREGYYIDYWTVSMSGTRMSRYDKTGNKSTGTYYMGDNVTSSYKSFTNLITPGDTSISHVRGTKDAVENSCVVTLTAHWAPIKYKVTYYNDTTAPTQFGTISLDYSYSTNIYTTPSRDYGTVYDIDNFGCTRSNKFGPSTFLGYGFELGDTSKVPSYVLLGKSPDSYVSVSGYRTQYTATDWAADSRGLSKDAAGNIVAQGSDGVPNNRKINENSTSYSDVYDTTMHTTTSGTSYYDYFKWINDTPIQAFSLYAVWDDCPGIVPFDYYQTFKGAYDLYMQRRTTTKRTQGNFLSELEAQILSGCSSTLYDREDNISNFKNDDTKYYLANFNAHGIDSYANRIDSDRPITFELDYTVVDDNGNKYHATKKLFCASASDILRGTNDFYSDTLRIVE